MEKVKHHHHHTKKVDPPPQEQGMLLDDPLEVAWQLFCFQTYKLRGGGGTTASLGHNPGSLGGGRCGEGVSSPDGCAFEMTGVPMGNTGA